MISSLGPNAWESLACMSVVVLFPHASNCLEEEWETELEAELRDYEVLAGDKPTTTEDIKWEKECHDLLGEDDDDLK